MRRTACWVALAATVQAHGQWRAAAYLGGAATAPTRVVIEQPALGTRLSVHDVRYRGESFTPPLYYGFRLGRFFGRLGVEAEFIHQKIYARTERVVRFEGQARGIPVDDSTAMHTLIPQFSISHGLNFLLFNAVLEQRLGRRTRVAARFGAGPTVPHAESNIMGEARQGYQLGRAGIQGAASLEFRLWRGLHWLGEYKFTRSEQRVKIVAGHAETLVRSHHGVFGLSAHF